MFTKLALSRILPCVALTLVPPVSAVPPEQAGRRSATRVALADEEVEKVEIVADEASPTRFTLVVVRQMPTPGFHWKVDAIEVDPDGRRIVARLTEMAPAGIVAQVLTPTRFEVPIGSIAVGSYFLEVATRRDPARDHRPAYAWLIEAR